MFKKLFGNRTDPEKLPHPAHLEHLLAEIALVTPQVDWAAFTKSILTVSFPSKPEVDIDRISAMGAAMSALGERIASELKDGELQYVLIAGTDGISVTIELSSECFLTIGLKQDVSIAEFLSRLQETHLPMLTKALRVEGPSRLSGIQQT